MPDELKPAKDVNLVIVKGTTRLERVVSAINRLDVIQKAASICVKERGVRSVEIRDTWNRIPYTITLRASEVQFAATMYRQQKIKEARARLDEAASAPATTE